MATGTPNCKAMATGTPNANAMDMTNDTVLQHLRHLLADAPELTPLRLYGGLDIWLFRNTQKILEWAGSARDATDPAFIQRQVYVPWLIWMECNTSGVMSHGVPHACANCLILL